MGFKSDIEIAQECEMLPITQIAEKAGIDDKYLEQYGKYKAKIDYNLLKESDKKDGKLILVTAINPTPAGEGKTTTTVGLADGMQRLGKSVMVALREPSLGPVFGVKGGATGGTVLHGKGVGMKRAEQFLGVSLVSEKEVILIVAKSSQKNAIMRAIMDKAGVDSKAGTIVFSLPVTSTAGLRILEDSQDEEVDDENNN